MKPRHKKYLKYGLFSFNNPVPFCLLMFNAECPHVTTPDFPLFPLFSSCFLHNNNKFVQVEIFLNTNIAKF